MGKKAKAESSKVWSIMSFAAAFGTTKITAKVLSTGWAKATGRKPPANPADPDVEMKEAVMWAMASGTAIALMRMLASRRAANYYLKSTGQLPPPLRKDTEENPFS